MRSDVKLAVCASPLIRPRQAQVDAQHRSLLQLGIVVSPKPNRLPSRRTYEMHDVETTAILKEMVREVRERWAEDRGFRAPKDLREA